MSSYQEDRITHHLAGQLDFLRPRASGLLVVVSLVIFSCAIAAESGHHHPSPSDSSPCAVCQAASQSLLSLDSGPCVTAQEPAPEILVTPPQRHPRRSDVRTSFRPRAPPAS